MRNAGIGRLNNQSLTSCRTPSYAARLRLSADCVNAYLKIVRVNLRMCKLPPAATSPEMQYSICRYCSSPRYGPHSRGWV